MLIVHLIRRQMLKEMLLYPNHEIIREGVVKGHGYPSMCGAHDHIVLGSTNRLEKF